MENKLTDYEMGEFFEKLMSKHKERLAYNAAYQRDLRKIKKFGLDCTVKEYRESLK